MKKNKYDDDYQLLLKERKKAAKLLALSYLAKSNFWYFLKAMDEDFFNEDKPYLKDLATQLQHFHDCPTDELDTLIINCPPRFGKSYILEMYEVWCKMSNPYSKSIIVCYNENLSLTFSKAVRNLISTPKINKWKLIPSDVFDDTYIKRGSSSQKMWSLNKSPQINFLATSPGGTVTGMAAGCGGKRHISKGGGNIIIDDLIKSAYEAYNERILEEHWSYFHETLFSRREPGSKMIICFTRWSTKDLVARYEEWAKENKKKYKKIIYKMEQEDGSPLHESLMTKKEMEERKSLIGERIWKANYQQEPEDINDRLYTKLYGYVDYDYEKCPECDYIPNKNYFGKIYAVCDVADKGTDYSCAIAFAIDKKENQIIILDVLYTQEKLQEFQYSLSTFIHKNEVAHIVIEDNMGGSLFCSDVQRLLSEMYNNSWTYIEPFHQGSNKEARIFSTAPHLERLVRFPYKMFTRYDEDGFYIICEKKQWREYMDHMINFISVEDSEHDDAEDATTLVVEFCTKNQLVV